MFAIFIEPSKCSFTSSASPISRPRLRVFGIPHSEFGSASPASRVRLRECSFARLASQFSFAKSASPAQLHEFGISNSASGVRLGWIYIARKFGMKRRCFKRVLLTLEALDFMRKLVNASRVCCLYDSGFLQKAQGIFYSLSFPFAGTSWRNPSMSIFFNAPPWHNG